MKKELDLLSEYMEYYVDNYFNTPRDIIEGFDIYGIVFDRVCRLSFEGWKEVNNRVP